PLLFKELYTLYAAARHGRNPEIPRPRPFRDYIAWLREQDLGRAESFWRQYLRGFTAPNPLPADRGTGKRVAPARRFQERLICLPGDLSSDLRAFARRHQVTLNAVLQGAWALLLARYGGTDDVTFGVLVSGRPPSLAGVESMLGMFLNTLPVRIRTPGGERL